MRKLKYVLTNGKVVNSLRLAQESGQGYKVVIENVTKQELHRTPKAQKMFDTIGRVKKAI